MCICALCERIKDIESDASLVYEFPHSYLLLGAHGFYRGYCVLVLKQHVRELHELDDATQIEFNRELMAATTAIAKAFTPWKINHASLANQVQHIHWHIIPRYQDDPDHRQHPWLHEQEFTQHHLSEDQKTKLIASIRGHLLLPETKLN